MILSFAPKSRIMADPPTADPMRERIELPAIFHGIPGMPNFSRGFHVLPLLQGNQRGHLCASGRPERSRKAPGKPTARRRTAGTPQASAGVRSRVALAE